MLDGLANASIEMEEAKVISYSWLICLFPKIVTVAILGHPQIVLFVLTYAKSVLPTFFFFVDVLKNFKFSNSFIGVLSQPMLRGSCLNLDLCRAGSIVGCWKVRHYHNGVLSVSTCSQIIGCFHICGHILTVCSSKLFSEGFPNSEERYCKE